MSLTYTGTLTAPLAGLRNLLAASTTFQAWVGAEDAEEAAASIYMFETPADDATRPYAVVYPENGWNMTSIAACGAGVEYMPWGKIGLLLEDEVPEAYTNDIEDAFINWLDTIEAIISDVCGLSGTTGTYLDMRGIESVYGPARTDSSERRQEGDIIQQIFHVSWGYGRD